MLSFLKELTPEELIAFMSMIIAAVAIFQTIVSQNESTKSSNYERVNTDFYSLISLLKDVKKEKSVELKRVEEEIEKCTDEEKINEVFERESKHIGEYFRILHQIFKYLNGALAKKNISLDEYELFIQILRTQFSGNELQFILINSLLTRRGVGMGVRLISSNFFGNTITIERRNNYYDLSQSLITDEFKDSLKMTTYDRDEKASNVIKIQKDIHCFMHKAREDEDSHNLVQLIKYFKEKYPNYRTSNT